MIRIAAAVTAAALMVTSVLAQSLPPPLTLADRDRLTQFDTNRMAAVADAMTATDKRDTAVLTAMLEGKPIPVVRGSLTGAWTCRTAKLGGSDTLKLVVYQTFKCVIRRESGALVLQKTTGSQRTKGVLYPAPDKPDRLIFAGAGTVNDEPPLSYGKIERQDEVGYLFQISPRRLRLELPRPQFESDFNIIELTR